MELRKRTHASWCFVLQSDPVAISNVPGGPLCFNMWLGKGMAGYGNLVNFGKNIKCSCGKELQARVCQIGKPWSTVTALYMAE